MGQGGVDDADFDAGKARFHLGQIPEHVAEPLLHAVGRAIGAQGVRATLLFKKKMLSEITEKLHATLPTQIRKDSGKVEIAVDLTEVSAQNEVLQVNGTLAMTPSKTE